MIEAQPYFLPPWYLRSGHLQTLITGFHRPRARLPQATVHRIPISPNDAMLAHENQPNGVHDSEIGYLLLHGLGSSHNGTYMTNIAANLLQEGHRVIRLDLPGAGRSYEYTELPPHGACSREVGLVIDHLSEKLGIKRWRLGGVSLGANVLLKLISRWNSQDEAADLPKPYTIERTVAVAPPIDLEECCVNMESGINRFYASYFISGLKRQARIRAEYWPRWRAMMPNVSFDNIRSFDDTLTAPLIGLPSATEYYREGSSINDLHKISSPTIIVIDEHDPIVPARIFDRATLSPYVEVLRTRFGGHVGYLTRSRSSRKRRFVRWADDWIARLLAAD